VALLDGIHPSALGYAHIAENWRVAVDAMLGVKCRKGGE
jgi:lysophospholipase L1-like esterase